MLRFKGKKRAVAAATARLRGLNQIRPPSKTQAFLRAAELRQRAGRCAKAARRTVRLVLINSELKSD